MTTRELQNKIAAMFPGKYVVVHTAAHPQNDVYYAVITNGAFSKTDTLHTGTTYSPEELLTVAEKLKEDANVR